MRTIVVVRHIETYRQLLKRTSLQVLLVPRYEILMALYDRASFQAVIYVNNGWTNFQSLAFQQAVHVHVNHGESDKICMVSNQAKAYDRVFIAGEAAERRHAAALAWFDPQHLVRIGRPQLDRVQANPTPRPTITYAPTWEGEDDVNNYTSVDRYGPRIVAAARAQGARVVYKPHPRILLSDDPGVRRGHDNIVAQLDGAHDYLPNTDILEVLAETDLLIADVSSVTLDHLYLRPDAALMLCDRRSDRAALLADAPIAHSAHVLDATTIENIESDMANLLADPSQQGNRAEIRDLYFDGLQPGQSTERFWTELQRAIAEHDRAVRNLSRTRVIT